MLSSPFKQPSRRQNALACQIQDAKAAGDEALRLRLISQWVHRYGFNSAAELDLNLPEPTISQPEVSPAAEAEEVSFTPESVVEQEVVAEEEVVAEAEEILVAEEVLAQAEEIVVEEEVDDQEELVAEAEETLVEEEVDDQAEVVAEEEVVAEDEVLLEKTVLQRNFTPGAVPAPPISTPRSLRRWLPRREDDVFPQAS